MANRSAVPLQRVHDLAVGDGSYPYIGQLRSLIAIFGISLRRKISSWTACLWTGDRQITEWHFARYSTLPES